MKKTTTEILAEYTEGAATMEQTNAELKAAKAGFHLDPNKNNLTPEEIMNGTAGLLDTGTGTMDKVKIDPKNMELINCDCGEMYALCIVQGKTYKVEGKKLVAVQ